MAQKIVQIGVKNVAIKNRITRCKLDGNSTPSCKISDL